MRLYGALNGWTVSFHNSLNKDVFSHLIKVHIYVVGNYCHCFSLLTVVLLGMSGWIMMICVCSFVVEEGVRERERGREKWWNICTFIPCMCTYQTFERRNRGTHTPHRRRRRRRHLKILCWINARWRDTLAGFFIFLEIFLEKCGRRKRVLCTAHTRWW